MDKTISSDYIKQHTEKEEILAGDASLRKYYRLHLTGSETLIKMVIHPDQKSDFKKVINTTDFLARYGVPVPAILSSDEENLSIYQEDAGPRHYFDIHNRLTLDQQLKWYLSFTECITAIQNLTSKFNIQKNIQIEVLDNNRLKWELDFFIENYYLKMHPGLLNDENLGYFRGWLDKIAHIVASYPVSLCHRDYHSKNIMINDNKPVIIDYQDMRMGPYNYDLVSLLWDSYLNINPEIIDKCEKHFFTNQETTGRSADQQLLQNRYTALQRNIKAVGTFASQYNRGNDTYLPFFGQTLHKVLSHLDYLSESPSIVNIFTLSPEL